MEPDHPPSKDPKLRARLIAHRLGAASDAELAELEERVRQLPAGRRKKILALLAPGMGGPDLWVKIGAATGILAFIGFCAFILTIALLATRKASEPPAEVATYMGEPPELPGADADPFGDAGGGESEAPGADPFADDSGDADADTAMEGDDAADPFAEAPPEEEPEPFSPPEIPRTFGGGSNGAPVTPAFPVTPATPTTFDYFDTPDAPSANPRFSLESLRNTLADSHISGPEPVGRDESRAALPGGLNEAPMGGTRASRKPDASGNQVEISGEESTTDRIVRRELVRRQATVTEAQASLERGLQAMKQGDSRKAEEEFEDALGRLPETQTATRALRDRGKVQEHVATIQQLTKEKDGLAARLKEVEAIMMQMPDTTSIDVVKKKMADLEEENNRLREEKKRLEEGPKPDPIVVRTMETAPPPLVNESGPARTREKMSRIVLPRVEMHEATVEEALKFLQAKSRELDAFGGDSAEKGINLVLREPDGSESASGSKVTLSLQDVPLSEAVKYVTELGGMQHRVSDSGTVVISPVTEAGGDLTTRSYRIRPGFLKAHGSKSMPSADPFAGAGEKRPNRRLSVVDLLKRNGLTFPSGSTAMVDPVTHQLIVRNSEANHEILERLDEVMDAKWRKYHSPNLPEIVEKQASKEPFSTFSLHVSDVSFKLAKDALARNQWPARDKIRTEEFVNAFDYGDPLPTRAEKVACAMEQAAHPFMQQRNLLRISMRTAATGRASGTPLRLTFVLDRSGSMERADRAAAVRRAFAILASMLQPQDKVTLIGFARRPQLLADQVPGNQSQKLVRIVSGLPSEGGTNIEAALKLATEKAHEQFHPQAQNRIILFTDGAANLGDAEPGSLSTLVENMRANGLAFDAGGFGIEGLNDEVLEALTRKGDGRYYVLDKPEDADEGFARQVAGALRPSARNVKVQVEFNPERVGGYKLFGFEKHRLKKEDFRDDKVDAAEMAAAEAGVAVYQVETKPEGTGDIGSVSVRFQDMSTGRMVEKRWAIPYSAAVPRVEDAADSMRVASAATLLAETLKGTPVGERVELDELPPWLAGLADSFANHPRVRSLHSMIESARNLGRR